MTLAADKKALAVLVSFSNNGGVERMMINLLQGFVASGQPVDLLMIRAQSAHLKQLPPQVNLIDLGAKHTLTALLPLMAYLRRRRPHALLVAKDRAIRVALLARRLTRSSARTRIVGRLGTNLSASLQHKHPLRQWLRCRPMRYFYRDIDLLVAVSRGVADDSAAVTGLPRARISVIPNPVVTPRLHIMAAQALSHRWFQKCQPPVILGAGRLTRQKDFPTLIQAFALVRQQRAARLLIVGEGQDRGALLKLAKQLGVADDVELPGFVENPYAFMAKAAVFALSSRWEGSPNVLTEAMAIGTPVVATDCPSGPRELLGDGRYGRLVAVGDHHGLATAIDEVLALPPDACRLRAAVAGYALESSTEAYLNALLPPPDR